VTVDDQEHLAVGVVLDKPLEPLRDGLGVALERFVRRHLGP
jgi:hypothetical protein